MADILRLQTADQLPPTPGEEKVSMTSVLQCHRSAVSYLLCQALGRWG